MLRKVKKEKNVEKRYKKEGAYLPKLDRPSKES